jgi:hypothetical protein
MIREEVDYASTLSNLAELYQMVEAFLEALERGGIGYCAAEQEVRT